jgi:hypothetical protein
MLEKRGRVTGSAFDTMGLEYEVLVLKVLLFMFVLLGNLGKLRI